jgi:hypothetical protein
LVEEDQEKHTQRHELLHFAYDELLADYLRHNPSASIRTASLWDLLAWSFSQTVTPTPSAQGFPR